MTPENFPSFLRPLRQWCACGPDKIPLTPTTGKRASSVDASTWGSLEEALAAGQPHAGIMLNDDVFCIDLDDPRYVKVNGVRLPNDPEYIARVTANQIKLSEIFPTYQEVSLSGNGLHILGLGKVSRGYRREGVEVYSKGRFIIMTGNIYKDSPLTDCSALLAELEAGIAPASVVEIDDQPDILSDENVLEMAGNAKNKEKFLHLFSGKINGHPSQSEADFALLAILCFYSQSNGQVRRLFRMSALGQRQKASRDDYLNRSIGQIRGRQVAETVPMVDFSRIGGSEPEPIPPPLPVQHHQESVQSEPLRQIYVEKPPLPAPDPYTLTFPPSLFGEIARYNYESAMRPTPEIAFCGAFGLLAAICGRQYNVSGLGLNAYLFTVAGTAIGKEEGPSAIGRMLEAVKPSAPSIENFIGHSAFSSGQAIRKMFDDHNSCLCMLGEVGHTFEQWCDPRAPAHIVQVRKELLDMYTKSRWGSTLLSTGYADKKNNAKTVKAPALTLLGDATPEKFFAHLDPSMVSEGFLPRVWVFEHLGQRKYAKESNFWYPPSEELVQKVAALVNIVKSMEDRNYCQIVKLDDEATKLSFAYDRETTDRINGANDSVAKELWSRAREKALKLAGLVAVGCDFHNPLVTAEIMAYAIAMATDDVSRMESKFATGVTGQGDHRQEDEIRKALTRYEAMSPAQRGHNNVSPKLQELPGAIPFAYFKKVLLARAIFTKDKRGGNLALRMALESMVTAGALIAVPTPTAMELWGVSGVVYRKGEGW